MTRRQFQASIAALTVLLLQTGGTALADPVPPAGGDIPADFKIVTDANDYIKRDIMIPMRDGVKLHTVVIIPKGAAHAPMILNRTPYNAGKFTSSAESPRRALVLPLSYGELATSSWPRMCAENISPKATT